MGMMWRDLSGSQRLRIRACLASLAVITLLFARPLSQLASVALQNNLHSYIPLVPVITVYLLMIQRRPHLANYSSSGAATAVFAAAGAAGTAAALIFRETLSTNDYLCLAIAGYVAFLEAATFLFLGSRWMTAAAFPMSFLVFMIPLPDLAVYWFEHGLVLASADAAAFLFEVTGTPLLRDGTVLALPGIVLRVAQECSGIRSSWVLFITSLVASHLLLRSPWRRAALVALVIPLGIIRNAFRILVIGLLCVYVGPHMVDSPIHRRGGPVFFALSLVPFFLMAIWLHRQESKHAARSIN